MTVPTTDITDGPYTGNGLSDNYDYNFRIEDKTEITVFETDTDGVVTTLTVDTDYTVNNVGSATGTVTRVAGNLPTGYVWYIRSNYPDTQLTDFDSQGGFFPDIHEKAFDKLTYLFQQLKDTTGRALRFPDSYPGSFDTDIPAPQALKYIRFNAAADAFELTDATSVITPADVVQSLDQATILTVTPVVDDDILIKDTSDSGKVKKVTVQSILDIIPSSNSIEATASGALANGDSVVLNSDGTVSVVVGSVAGAGTPVVYKSSETQTQAVCYDTVNNKFVIAYVDFTDGSKGKAVVGTVAGTAITFGTPVVFNTAATGQAVAITFDAASGKVVIAYPDSAGANIGQAIVGTVSGTSISFGTEVTFSSSLVTACSIAYSIAAGKVVIAFNHGSGGGAVTGAIVGTVSGTSISFGTQVSIVGVNAQYLCIAYDVSADRMVCAYQNPSSGPNHVYAIVGTVSGTSISFGTQVQPENVTGAYPALAYDSVNSKMLLAYMSNSNPGKVAVGTVSGTAISFGTPVQWSASVSSVAAAFSTVAGKLVVSFKDRAGSNDGNFVVGTVSGTTISFTSQVNFTTNALDDLYSEAAYDPDSGQVLVTYQDDGNSAYGTAVLLTADETNLTADNFIGFSNGVYADAATSTIQTVGAVDDAQTGLTTAEKYYVLSTGTLSTTAGTPEAYVGVALSATEILIKG
jgi:hypothetical protein